MKKYGYVLLAFLLCFPLGMNGRKKGNYEPLLEKDMRRMP